MKTKIILVGLLAISMNVFAADSWTKCAACHGENGEKKALGKSKVVSEMSKEDIAVAIRGYKDGTYGGPMKALMKGQVASLTEEDIEFISNKIGTEKED